MTKLEKLRHLINAAHNYAALEYDCTLTILQEYKDEEYVTVGLYDDGTDPESEDPTTVATVKVIENAPYNCNFVLLHRTPGGHVLFKEPADLFRLLYA